MQRQVIVDKKETLVRQFGPWTAHNIHLGDGIYTIDENAPGQVEVLRRLIQIIQDIAHRPLRDLRVLDLACLEGLYGTELALQGARVVGIEGRHTNIEKARFVKETLSLTNLELIQDDVRRISTEKYGQFDVVLCAGILYHLDVPDVFRFVERIFEVSTDLAIFETHIAGAVKEVHVYKNRRYSGSPYAEHDPDSSREEKEKLLWASLDNPRSFWFTKPSLLNFLSHTGFTSVYECHNPSTVHDFADRVTLVAVKGTRKSLLCSPPLNLRMEEDWPEKPQRGVHPSQKTRLERSLSVAASLIPAPAKGFLKRLIGV
jgi:SAM-dependent methyltransferase